MAREAGDPRAVIVCSGYDEASHFKDPGLIASELQRLGYDVTCLVAQKGLAGAPHAAWPVKLIPGLPGATVSWNDCHADLFLIYALDPVQSTWVNAIRAGNPDARIILKCDSDGLMSGYSATVRSRAALYQKDLIWFREIGNARAMFQHPAWKAPLRIAAHLAWFVVRRRPADAGRIQNLRTNLELFERVIIESTEGLNNLLLMFPDIAKRALVVPNGVPSHPLAPRHSPARNIVVAGRLTDHRAKRPLTAWHALVPFLERHPGWTVDFLGPYDDRLAEAVRRCPLSISSRTRLRGPCTNAEVRAVMGDSDIFFSASAFEGFSIAMAEAVSEGCSLVSTPIPCAWDLAAGGKSGTIAASFSATDLSNALTDDVEKWEKGQYDRTQIASYWQPRLDWPALVRQMLE
jgi:glycosyltransferase involved in cell wall biosynthesis